MIIDIGQGRRLRESSAMKTGAVSVFRGQSGAHSQLAGRIVDFVSLMKPRVMLLVVFTALVGLAIAPVHPNAFPCVIAIVAIAAGAGAAGALNMWYDSDIDAVMARTASRPIPRGSISRAEALTAGLVVACGAVAMLAAATNLVAALLLAVTIFFYVAVYTMWLKRRTPQNIVIGGAAGAFPPVIGWAAATGGVSLEPAVLFLIIFLWTPPHFWALSLNRTGDYARAAVPMLPVIAGRAATTLQMLIYSILLFPVSLLPWILGWAGTIYAAFAAAGGVVLVALSVKLHAGASTGRRDATRLFGFSIIYLFVLFAALLLDHGVGGVLPAFSTSGAAR
jgi:protoheme IX farnesyltransferase